MKNGEDRDRAWKIPIFDHPSSTSIYSVMNRRVAVVVAASLGSPQRTPSIELNQEKSLDIEVVFRSISSTRRGHG